MNINLNVFGDRPLMVIGYKYNSPKTLLFISTDGVRGTDPGHLYLYLFPDTYYNGSIHTVVYLYINNMYLNA